MFIEVRKKLPRKISKNLIILVKYTRGFAVNGYLISSVTVQESPFICEKRVHRLVHFI